MTTEWLPWDSADHLRTEADILMYLEAVLEDGEPLLVASALNTVAKALGRSDFHAVEATSLLSVIGQLKSLGFELTAKAA